MNGYNPVTLGMQFLIQRGSARGGSNLETPLPTWARRHQSAIPTILQLSPSRASRNTSG
jgi:hypothetical protein